MSERHDLTFMVDGQMCSASIYTPPSPLGPLPCVVMAHGTTGTMDFALPSYAARFTRAGLAVFVFDYRHFGASDGEPRQLIRVPEQLQDMRAAVAFARSRPELDAQRTALWGTSLGAGHVLSIAATDPSIAAVVAQLPFLGVDPRNESPRTTSVTLTLFTQAVRDTVGAWFGSVPVMMPMLGRPGEVAVFTGQEDYEAVEALAATAPMWRNEMAARSLFSLLRYRPVSLARDVRAPMLFLVAEGDTAASNRLTEHAAREAPRGELRRYPGSHFSAYQGPVFEQMVADETAFLVEHLAEHAGAH